MHTRPVTAFALVLGIALVGCGDDPASVDHPCPGDLVRSSAGSCVPPETTCDPGGLRIVEVMPESDGGATGPFVEIAGRSGHSVAGMVVAVFGGDGVQLGTVTLAGEADGQGLYVVQAGPDTPLGTVPKAGGAVRLVDCEGTVVDAIAWGEFGDGSAFPGEGEPARIPPDGASLARCAGAVDTDDNSVDFGVADPTPGTPGSAADFADPTFCAGEGDCIVGELGGNVRIEELLYDPEGTDADNEFIEIGGTPGTPVDGVRIEGVNGSNGSALFQPIVLSGTIGESGTFVIGGAEVSGVDIPLESVTIQNGPDTIVLRDCDGVGVLDAVAWGTFEGEEVSAGEGESAVDAPEGRSIARCGAKGDTGDNAADFAAATPSPGRLSAEGDFLDPFFCGEGCTTGAFGDVRINEVVPNPEGADGAAAAEFIELRGEAGRTAVGLWVEGINGTNGTAFYGPVALEGAFGDDGFFVLGQSSIADAEQLLDGALQNGPETIVLYDCDGTTVLDAVAYGNFGEEHVFLGEGTAAPVRDGMSTARCEDVGDSNENAADFGLASPTPGAANADFDDPLFCFAASCVGMDAGSVLINEVYYDPPGADGSGDGEFIELVAQPDADLTGMRVAGVNGNNGEPYVGPIGVIGSADESGFFLLGGAAVAGADALLPRPLQNGPDSVVLYDCEGAIIDAVAYEDFDVDEFPAGEGTPAAGATDTSIGRTEGGDTDDNATDFAVQDAPSPRAANDGP